MNGEGGGGYRCPDPCEGGMTYIMDVNQYSDD